MRDGVVIEERATGLCIRINSDRDNPQQTLDLQEMLPKEYSDKAPSICRLKQNVGESAALWWRKDNKTRPSVSKEDVESVDGLI